MEKFDLDKINLDLSENYTNDVIPSNQSNQSSLKEAFVERLKFIKGGSPILLPDGFDFVKTGFYFGKVNEKGQVIIPKRSSFQLVDPKFTDDEEIYLNKDLYNIYQNFYDIRKYDFAIGKNQIDLFSEVFLIQKGAQLPEEVEEDYLDFASDLILDKFEDFILGTPLDQASNFDLFIKTIYSLFKEQRIGPEILYSNYILSFRNSMLNSGLGFEIGDANAPYDNNEFKFDNFYRIPQYGGLVCLCYLSGMRYDKNVPWRFFMDFNLSSTKSQLKNKQLKDYFEENFEVVEGSYKEFELLYYSFFKAYLKILKQYSLIFKSEQIVKSCSKSNTKINRSYSIQRKILTEYEYQDYYIQNYLINNNLIYYYSDLLSFIFKSNKNINKLKFNIERILKKGLDRKSVIEYTYNTLKNCSKQTRRKNVLSNTSKQGISSRSSY